MTDTLIHRGHQVAFTSENAELVYATEIGGRQFPLASIPGAQASALYTRQALEILDAYLDHTPTHQLTIAAHGEHATATSTLAPGHPVPASVFGYFDVFDLVGDFVDEFPVEWLPTGADQSQASAAELTSAYLTGIAADPCAARDWDLAVSLLEALTDSDASRKRFVAENGINEAGEVFVRIAPTGDALPADALHAQIARHPYLARWLIALGIDPFIF